MIAVIFLVISSTCLVTGKETNRTHILTQILCRHGVRAPLVSYPNDPNYDESNWPNGYGQLTELGKIGQQELGIFLRNRYKDVLSQSFSDKEVRAISSDYDRAILSAQALLSGLYNPEGNWQLYPVHTIPVEYDSLLQPKVVNSNIKNVYKCHKYRKLFKEILNSSLVHQYTKDNIELYEFLKANSGYPMKTLIDSGYFIGTLVIEDLYNMTIPTWAKDTIHNPETMRTLAFSSKVFTWTDEMKRLSAGPLLSNFIDNMLAKINGSDSRKLYIYSGHDFILSNMLDTLKVLDQHWPHFSNTLILDLYSEDSTGNGNKSHVVQVSYRNSTTVEPYIMKIPGCDDFCPLENFIEIMKPYMPEDLITECQIEPLTSNNCAPGSNTERIILLGVVLVLVILLITLLAIYVCSRCKTSD